MWVHLFFKVCIYLHGCVNASICRECTATHQHRRMSSDPLELELKAFVSCQIWGWESNLGSPVLLVAKSSLQPLERILDWEKNRYSKCLWSPTWTLACKAGLSAEQAGGWHGPAGRRAAFCRVWQKPRPTQSQCRDPEVRVITSSIMRFY